VIGHQVLILIGSKPHKVSLLHGDQTATNTANKGKATLSLLFCILSIVAVTALIQS